MQSKLGRLKKRSEFLKVAGSGRKWVAPGFVLQALQRPAGNGFDADQGIRVGFTASRKVGNAVARNRAKRRLRAACQEVLQPTGQPGPGQPGHDYVVIARNQTLTEPYQRLVTDLSKGVRRLADKTSRRGGRGPLGDAGRRPARKGRA